MNEIKIKKPSLIKQLLKDNKVASIKSSSKFAVENICKKIDFSLDLIIIEYGPGNGVISKELLKKMNKNSKLILIETNKEFSNFLSKIKDDRLIVVNGNAIKIKEILSGLKIKEVDIVISGIPFSMIKKNERKIIVESTYKILNKDGYFLVYQFTKAVEKYLRLSFDKIKLSYEIRNLPPLFIFECKK